MNNYKIVIDAGHGGSDTGAVGNGIVEKDLALKISKYMDKRFKELGVPVVMTREVDETLTPKERVKRIDNAYGDVEGVIIVSNHINAGSGDGAEVIYALRNNSTLATSILKEINRSGQNIREAFQKRLPSNTAKDYYFIHRDTGKYTQPVIVEYGFLDSNDDDISQLKNNYEFYAEAVVKAISEYLGIKYVPTLAGDIKNYIVKKGDSLYKIAKNNNTTVANIQSLNKLETTNLSIGQILKLPENIETVKNIYIVKSGDSLYKIAKQFNTSVADIMEYNKLTTNLISLNQQLEIPITNSSNKTYTVKSGDSLWSIAKRFAITVNELKAKNNLTSNSLRIGQILKL